MVVSAESGIWRPLALHPATLRRLRCRREGRIRAFHRQKRMKPPVSEEFYRIKRLPPYVIAEVNAHAGSSTRGGRDIIDLGMGNPDLPPPQHVIDKLCEVAHEARRARLFAVEGHPRAAQGPGQLLRPPLRRRARSRDRSRRHAWARRKASPASPRRSPRRATSCWRPTRATRSTPSASSSPGATIRCGADHARRALLASRSTGRWRFTVPRPSHPGGQLPVEPDRRDGRPRLLRAAGRLGEGEQGLGALRPRLFGALLRRQPDPLDPAGARARRTSRSSSPRCPRPIRWPAGGSASRSATRS